MKSFKSYLEEKRCWPGYKPVPGKKAFEPGSCVKEGVDMYSQWSNKEPVEYVKYLTKHFGAPEELTEKRAVWYNKDGFKRIEVLDEYILHASPLPHYDFVYCYVDLKVPHNLANKLAESSESITVDFLKNEVGARCASLTANAVTLNYVLDVVEGRVKPSKEVYESQIKSMKSMFESGKKYELDWWPDESGDADPKNPYYKESTNEHFNQCGCSINEVDAWQRKEGKNPEGGLNRKGVESYRRANPGSKLQTAVTTKPSKLKPGSKAAERRLSFCRRMKGMKDKLTSAETARDPDSRINKSLRKWNC
jgi:hypothetical protein